MNVNDSQNLAFATSHFVIEVFPFDYLSNQKQRKSTKKKGHFKRNNSSHSCRTFSTVELFCRSWHAEHFCSLNLTSISYSFWNKGRKVIKFYWLMLFLYPGELCRQQSKGKKTHKITSPLSSTECEWSNLCLKLLQCTRSIGRG
jgi:phosphorylcholine metabolism protein LicD